MQKLSISARDLGNAIKRVGASADEAGIKIQDLTVMLMKGRTKTKRSGHILGNALKTIFVRLKQEETLYRLASLGVIVEDGNRLKRPQYILNTIANNWHTYSSSQRRDIAEALGGVYQITVVRAIFS
jgi:TP901 family phage tail tape measure protein